MDTNVSKASCLESSRKNIYQSPSPSSKHLKLSTVGYRDKLNSFTTILHDKSVTNSKRIQSILKPIQRSASKKDTIDDTKDLVKSQKNKKRDPSSPTEFQENHDFLRSSSRRELKASESFRRLQLIQMTPTKEKSEKEVDNLFSSPTRDASPISSQETELIPELIEHDTLATKSKVEHFFLELHEALNKYGYIPNELTILMPEIQQSLAYLKSEMKGLCIILDLMEDILASLNTTQTPSDLQKSVELTLALIEAHPMDDNISRSLTDYLDNKLRSIEEHMRITISNIPLKSLTDLKKLACPPADIQTLSYALLTLFTQINSNLDTSANGFSRVMNSRAWETMNLFLSKPGNVIQTMRKYADCVKDGKISMNIVKKAKEIFSKICVENLKVVDINVVSAIYDFMIDALYFYDIWAQIKPMLPIQKRRQNSSQALRTNPNINKDTLKSPAKRLNKSPIVKANTSPRKVKSRSRSSCDLSKPIIPKLNLNLANNPIVAYPPADSLNSFEVQHSTQQSFAEYVDTLKTSTLPYQSVQEGMPAPIDSKDSDAFEVMFHQPSIIQEVYSDSKPDDTKERLLNSERKHQYTLSLNGDCNFMFLTAECARHKGSPMAISENPFPITSALISDRSQELSLDMDLLDEAEYKHGDTPKFSERAQHKSTQEKFEVTSDYYSKSPHQQEYADDEFAIPIDQEESTLVSCITSVYKCMVKPTVEPYQVIKREINYGGLVKPVVNLDVNKCRNETEIINNTSTHEIQAQFTGCDLSCIELDESITMLMPIVQSLDEQYKDWPAAAAHKDSIRKQRVRDILRKRGVSSDYPLKPRTAERKQPPPVLPESKLEIQNTEENTVPLLDISSNVHEISLNRSIYKSYKSFNKRQLLNLTSKSVLSSVRCRSNSERAFCSMSDNLNTSRDSIKPLVIELESEIEDEKKSLRSLESISKKEEWDDQREYKKKLQQNENKKLLRDIKYQKEQILKDKKLREEKNLKERQEEFRKKEEEHQERKRVKLLKEQNQQKLMKEEIERNRAKAALAMKSKSPSKVRVKSAGIKLLSDRKSSTVLMRKLDVDDNEVRLQEKASELLCTRKIIMNEKRKLQVLLDKYKKK